MGEIFRPNSRYVRDTLGDGTVVLDLNNKIVLLSGEYGNEMIEGVLAFNTNSESDSNLYREDFNEYVQGLRLNKKAYADRCRIAQNVFGENVIRYYDRYDYQYKKGQHNTGYRATLPDDWQNYGYTAGKQNGRRVSGEATSGVSEHSIISKKKTRNFYSDVDYSDLSLLDDEQLRVYNDRGCLGN